MNYKQRAVLKNRQLCNLLALCLSARTCGGQVAYYNSELIRSQVARVEVAWKGVNSSTSWLEGHHRVHKHSQNTQTLVSTTMQLQILLNINVNSKLAGKR